MTDAEQTSKFGLWRYAPRVLPYVRPYRKLAALSVILTLLGALLSLAQPWPLAVMLNTVSGQGPPWLFSSVGVTSKYSILAVSVAVFFLITVVSHSLTVVNSYVDTKLEQNMILDFRGELFEHAERLSLAFHDSRRAGELMSRINYQAASLGSIVMAVPPVAQSLLTLVGMATIAFLIDWRITLISLSAVPLIYYALGIYGSKIVPRLERVQSLEWQSLSIVNEAMAMLRVIVAFNRERYEARRFKEQARVAVDERIALTVRQTGFTLGVQTATALGTALVFGFGFAAKFHGDITVGSLIVLLSYVSSIYAPLEAISNTAGAMNQHLVQFRASLALLDTQPEVKEAARCVDLARSTGAVAFERVSFSYPGRPRVLDEISFEVPPGARVALIGPTGAGKTTLASLLVRFYDPDAGRILVDGVDIRDLRLQSLRAQLAVVLQEPLLFSGTIAENIRYGRLDATDDQVVAAATSANAHEFISRLPNGYETIVGERGAQLSGGERQRICVARAFIKDAPILILDEPTSSIDSKTENVILDALDELMYGRTSLMIAHRLSTVREADLILVLSQGRIVQQGTHDELVEQDGLYRQLYEAQRRRRRRLETPIGVG